MREGCALRRYGKGEIELGAESGENVRKEETLLRCLLPKVTNQLTEVLEELEPRGFVHGDIQPRLEISSRCRRAAHRFRLSRRIGILETGTTRYDRKVQSGAL